MKVGAWASERSFDREVACQTAAAAAGVAPRVYASAWRSGRVGVVVMERLTCPSFHAWLAWVAKDLLRRPAFKTSTRWIVDPRVHRLPLVRAWARERTRVRSKLATAAIRHGLGAASRNHFAVRDPSFARRRFGLDIEAIYPSELSARHPAAMAATRPRRRYRRDPVVETCRETPSGDIHDANLVFDVPAAADDAFRDSHADPKGVKRRLMREIAKGPGGGARLAIRPRGNRVAATPRRQRARSWAALSGYIVSLLSASRTIHVGGRGVDATRLRGISTR